MKIEKIMILSLIIGFLMIITGIILLVIDTIEESRCYSSSLYELYHNNDCKRYWKK